MKFSRKLHCCSSLAYHGTAFIRVKHNKIYLPLPRARTPPLPPALGGDAAGAGSCVPPPARGPPERGAPTQGPPARGQARWLGPPAGGPPAYGASWECEIVPGLLVPSLCSLRHPLVVRRGRKDVEFGAKTAFRKVDALDFLAASASNGPLQSLILLGKICQS